jgi:hypothetical protein
MSNILESDPYDITNRKRKIRSDETQPWEVGSDPTNKSDRHVGKWTAEEEVYSEHLIQLFVKGSLPDCRAGTTLRAYLAEKLNCKPMRITKKYSTDIYDGKLLYSQTDAEIPSPAYLTAIRDNYLSSIVKEPKVRRAQKKPRSGGDFIESSGTDNRIGQIGGDSSCSGGSTQGSNSGVDSYSPASGVDCSDEDEDGQLTPEDIEMIQEALGEISP